MQEVAFRFVFAVAILCKAPAVFGTSDLFSVLLGFEVIFFCDNRFYHVLRHGYMFRFSIYCCSPWCSIGGLFFVDVYVHFVVIFHGVYVVFLCSLVGFTSWWSFISVSFSFHFVSSNSVWICDFVLRPLVVFCLFQSFFLFFCRVVLLFVSVQACWARAFIWVFRFSGFIWFFFMVFYVPFWCDITC